MLIWRPGKGRGFYKGSQPVLGTFDYRQVPGVGTFEFHLFMNASVELKL